MRTTLLENISHLCVEAQQMVLNESPQGWLVGDVPEPIRGWLGSERKYFLDLGFEDWPDAGNLMALASDGLNIPGTGCLLRSPRTHELTIERGEVEISLRDDWLTYVQLCDFRKEGDALVWFGLNVRPDRRAGDFEAHPERFEFDGNGMRRIAD